MNSINSNLMALHAANTLNKHYENLSASVSRLSSGLRVNSAADDAAGLAIRELMRADVAALSQGQRNANDAISMIQVADGALSVIDEKLIRMKELAEQAATGTYDSTQRLMIDSEFQAMAAEIDRIARATDFNGIKLLDGSLSGAHDGKGLRAAGAMKIHFGSGNDSAEDYYYVDIADCSTKGLGLRQTKKAAAASPDTRRLETSQQEAQTAADGTMEYGKFSVNANGISLNDALGPDGKALAAGQIVRDHANRLQWSELIAQQGEWKLTARTNSVSFNYAPVVDNCSIIRIPAGTTDVVINILGVEQCHPPMYGDNDIEVFTLSGKHLVGTPLTDAVFTETLHTDRDEKLPTLVNRSMLDIIKIYGKVNTDNYDASDLNTGPDVYDSTTLKYSTWNGMTFGYTGDSERQDSVPENLAMEDGPDYETLTIDVVTEDLIIALPGSAGAFIKAFQGTLDVTPTNAPSRNPDPPLDPDAPPAGEEDDSEPLSIESQEKAQKALVTIDNAIVAKDKVRAHLGALQNRLENTVSNLSIQAVNLQASESRISDADIALEMTGFVRQQVISHSAIAMLGQANSYPQMLMQLLG